MNRGFKVLQANLRKMSGTQHSLMNDESLRDVSLLLISEPYLFRNPDGKFQAVPLSHPYWNAILPEGYEGNPRPRAMIWTHRDTPAQPIPTGSPDITAALLNVGQRKILAISVYIPGKENAEDAELHDRIRKIQATVASARRSQSEQVELIIAGDFNRHDQQWGGDRVALSPRQGEGEPIIQMMSELDLQCPLPRGVTTWHSTDDELCSTIDLILLTPNLTEEVTLCTTDDTKHGSDHCAIRTEFALELERIEAPPRRLWKKARWGLVREMVQKALETQPEPADPRDVECYNQYILDLVAPAVTKHVPLATPSPYSKRWWTEDLTQLRQDYTYWRNKARAL